MFRVVGHCERLEDFLDIKHDAMQVDELVLSEGNPPQPPTHNPSPSPIETSNEGLVSYFIALFAQILLD